MHTQNQSIVHPVRICLACAMALGLLTAGEQAAKTPARTPVERPTLEQLAGTWSGTSSFSMNKSNSFEITLDKDGNVTAGSWVGHPFQKKGKAVLKTGEANAPFEISFYFADVCPTVAKKITNAKMRGDGRSLEMVADVTNSCYPVSSGNVVLAKRKAR